MASLRDDLNNETYDFLLKINLPDYLKTTKYKVAVVDIDERSIQQVGRWPWPRKIVSELTDKLQQAGATVVGFDIVFTQPEDNMAKALLLEANKNPVENQNSIRFLQSKIPAFDFDKMLEKSFEKGETVLGFVFHNDTTLKNSGILPPPIALLDKNAAETSLVFHMLRYRANIEPLQKAAKHGGFVTIFPDGDGVLRRAPLLMLYQDALYPSLDMEMLRQYLLLDKITVETERVGKGLAVSAIQIGDARIPTDEHGQVFIPYHKKFNKRQLISAVDLLNNKFDASLIKNALVIVGSSALSLNDIHATPIDPVYPGLFIHADILNSLISGDFSVKPTWAPGAEFALTLLLGLLCVFLFPFLGALEIIIISLVLIGSIFYGNYYALHYERIIISTLVPVLTILIITIANLVYGFFFEVRSRAKLRNMFGQYVPNELVNIMNENPEHYGFEGETKTLTVLFSDIRSFTTISEKLTVVQLKELLNQYLTPITEAIFKHRGTIDKYVGDMVMAFWGAPVEDPDHAKNAMLCALEMIAITEKLKLAFVKKGLPPVEIGIGINTGLMNVGDMGSQFRRAYTVLGNAVNLGSRLEGLSKQYGVKIVVGEESVQNQEGFVFRKLDRVKVKGKEQPTEIYALIGTEEETSPEIIKEISEYEQVLEAYFSGDFKTALAQFIDLDKRYPNQKLYQLYIDRVQDLISHPPETWDGVYEWKIK